MKNTVVSKLYRNIELNAPAYLICAAFFICGCIAGTVTAGMLKEGTGLYDTLKSVSALETAGRDHSFAYTLLVNAKYHLVALVFGFSALGAVTLPLLMGARGFFLTFTVSAVVRILGWEGVLLTFGLIGFAPFLTLPCLLSLASNSFDNALCIWRAVFLPDKRTIDPILNRKFLILILVSVLFLILATFADSYIMPAIIKLFADKI